MRWIPLLSQVIYFLTGDSHSPWPTLLFVLLFQLHLSWSCFRWPWDHRWAIFLVNIQCNILLSVLAIYFNGFLVSFFMVFRILNILNLDWSTLFLENINNLLFQIHCDGWLFIDIVIMYGKWGHCIVAFLLFITSIFRVKVRFWRKSVLIFYFRLVCEIRSDGFELAL